MSTSGLVQILSDAQCHLRTSSNLSGAHSQFNAILNYTTNASASADGSEGWCSSILNTNQFIVAGCEVPRTFKAVAIQGRGDADQWVTSYKIRYSLDNVVWTEYRNGAAITGCNDRNTIQTHFFDTPIRARSIAIHPLSWKTHISLRFELYALKSEYLSVQQGYTDKIFTPPISGADPVRGFTIPVTFKSEFVKPPKITVAFNRIHENSPTHTTENHPLAIICEQKNVTTKGFDCVITAESYCQLHIFSMSWIAVGRE